MLRCDARVSGTPARVGVAELRFHRDGVVWTLRTPISGWRG
jgi:hypothetical protein